MAELLAEPQCPQPVLPEPPTMAQLAEEVSALSERLAILEARLAPKPRRGNGGVCRTGWRPGRQRFGFRPHSKIPGRLVEELAAVRREREGVQEALQRTGAVNGPWKP